MPAPSAPERPIQGKAEDQLERARFIERLASALVNPEFKKSTGVVVGITGPWGSGKSSILNLLNEYLVEKYPNALVVRFDPWLVSGRNDLIAEFLGELIGTINADEKRRAKFKDIGATIAQYGAQLAPLSNLFAPGLSAIVAGGLGAAERALSTKESLSSLRARLITELRAASTPIVVLIDELDRVEDAEIRAVAQLVRSVLDFPAISYVLAFDPERVIQALGSGANGNERRDRGRSYLEKIVQLQIPIPITFGQEILRLLIAELTAIRKELGLPDDFQKIERFGDLLQLLTADVIQTPRDIRRLIGTFHVYAGMLYGEVDWIDLLAYSALLIKAPGTIAKMRRDPEDFSDELFSRPKFTRIAKDEKQTIEERLTEIIPSHELNSQTKALIAFLFPTLSESQRSAEDSTDALHKRRPLLNTLRLGLLPGAYSREKVQALFKGDPHEIESQLNDAYETNVIDALTDRIYDLYSELPLENAVSFWRGVAGFAAKPGCEWMTAYCSMHEKIHNLAEILEESVRRAPDSRESAVKIFSQLMSDGESELVARWIRSHFFVWGLYGNRSESTNKWFLNSTQTETVARELATKWRTEQLSGKLVSCRWDLQPVDTMVDMGIWDTPCRSGLDQSLSEQRALDGFTLMLYGGAYVTGRETLGKMCDLEKYLERVKSRLESTTSIEPTVRVALKKAAGRGAYG